MTAYLVRLKKNAELVGLFVSPTGDMLWEFIDECCDPYECEFVKLPPGSLYLHQAGAPTVPTLIPDPEQEDSYPDGFSGSIVSELWLGIFHGGHGELEWQPIEPSD